MPSMVTSGSSMSSAKWTKPMVATWPTMAYQRSSISCCMLRRPAPCASSAGASSNRAGLAGAPAPGVRGSIRLLRAALAPVAADAPFLQREAPGAEGHQQGQREPGQRIAQVVVAEPYHRQPAAGPGAAGLDRRGGVGVDEVGQGAGQAAVGGDGLHVARVPTLLLRLVAAQE